MRVMASPRRLGAVSLTGEDVQIGEWVLVSLSADNECQVPRERSEGVGLDKSPLWVRR
jgi:hypothetical protein